MLTNEVPTLEDVPPIAATFPHSLDLRDHLIANSRRPVPENGAIVNGGIHLSSIAVHELRAPLQALTTSVELLVEEESVAEAPHARTLASTVLRQSLWLCTLVENLLCVSALNEGRFHLQRRRAYLDEIILDVQPIVRPLLAKKGQRLFLRLDGDLPQVFTDSQKLGQALINLILNASKYSPADTPIEVRLTSRRKGDHEYVRVSVADRGPGLPEEGADALFIPFYRGSNAAGSDAGGVGLGLSIVKAIVEAHGGQVGAENRPTGGACFYLDLPALTDSAVQEPQPQPVLLAA